jgi:hypothetical protein
MAVLALATFQPNLAALEPVRSLGVTLLGSTARMGYVVGACRGLRGEFFLYISLLPPECDA